MLKDEIEEICIKVARNLEDTEQVATIALNEENAFMEGMLLPWEPYSLDYGYPGLLVLFSELAMQFPQHHWKKTCTFLMGKIIKIASADKPRNYSLFSGFTGICFAAQLMSKNDSDFSNVDNQFCFLLLEHIEHYCLEPMEDEEKRGIPLNPLDFDALNGLPCFVFYLLAYKDIPYIREILQRILRQLIRFSMSVSLEKGKLPGWCINVNDHRMQKALQQHQTNHLLSTYYFETGVAHGISGSLAALSKAYSCHVTIDGHKEAIERIIKWLRLSQQQVGDHGLVWPRRIGLNSNDSMILEVKENHYFDGWAHTTPGILNSLLLAATAMKCQQLTQYCENEFIKMGKRVCHHHTSIGLSFSYGLAGIVVILNNAATITKNKEIMNISIELAQQIVDQYNPDHPFGFKCVAPTNDVEERLLIHNPGLMTGSAGILLSLLSLHVKPYTEWTSLFLLN